MPYHFLRPSPLSSFLSQASRMAVQVPGTGHSLNPSAAFSSSAERPEGWVSDVLCRAYKCSCFFVLGAFVAAANCHAAIRELCKLCLSSDAVRVSLAFVAPAISDASV